MKKFPANNDNDGRYAFSLALKRQLKDQVQ